MSTFSQNEYSKKKDDLSNLRFEAKVMRLRACKMRIDALMMRIRARAILEENRNLVAIYQEWFVK
ncbi:hypothetical protein B7486_17985 [cyanobacterium TDX16]|nr:hypothetical protein B7486_17985 [cyanobacterium TDX16]